MRLDNRERTIREIDNRKEKVKKSKKNKKIKKENNRYRICIKKI